jgi:hypothetical protein
LAAPIDPSRQISPKVAIAAASFALVFLAEAAFNLFLLADFCGVRLLGMAAKKNPGGSLKCVSAVARTCPSKGFDNWQPAPLWVLLVPLVVVRISFGLTAVLSWTWQDVKREVVLLLESHGDSTPGGPVRVC